MPASPARLHAACLSSRDDASPAVHVLVNDGEIRAIAPLEKVRSIGLTRYRSIGRDLHEPFHFLYADDAALRDLAAGLRESGGGPILLGRLPADGPEERALRSSMRLGDLIYTTDGGTSPYVPLAAGFDQVFGRLSSARRTELRRKRKAAEKLGTVRYTVVVPRRDQLAAPLSAFLRIEASGWKGQSNSAILRKPETARFFEAYAKTLADENKLWLFFLTIGDTLVASRLAILHDQCLWELKIAYDERFAKVSPGTLLTFETIRHACELGLQRFEFLGRRSEWNRWWGVELRRHSTVRYYPRGVTSLTCLAADAAAFSISAAKRRFGLIGLAGSSGPPQHKPAGIVA